MTERATLGVRAGQRRTEFNEHSEALFLTSSFTFNSAEEQAADPTAGVHVAVRDPARLEVDAVAPQQPAVARLDLAGELRAVLVAAERPAERGPVDPGRREVRGVGAEVEDDRVRPLGVDAAGVVEEREPQWKYWPPSMTIV